MLGVGGLCGFCNERNTIYTVRDTEKVKRRWRNSSGKFLQKSSLKDQNTCHLLLKEKVNDTKDDRKSSERHRRLSKVRIAVCSMRRPDAI